jgi:glycerophosphoryl diester phosphodiesterase
VRSAAYYRAVPQLRHPFLDAHVPVAIAHRGGALETTENTRTAFEYAVGLGYDYLETDIQVTRDGVAVLFHDDRLDRTTDATGRVSDLTWNELRGVATAAGSDQIMRLDEALEHFPRQRFNVDLKSAGAIEPFCDVMSATGAFDRVIVASFSDARLTIVRRRFGPRLATAAGPREITQAVAAARTGRRFPAAPIALQIPVDVPLGPRRVSVATVGLVNAAHRHGVHVHVWTVSDRETIIRLLEMGVDGIMTDRPLLLREVLVERGEWRSDPN